ncbi:MAG: type II toxin-antitoxin system RelE/ParE family toxin [Coriobacteriia bacterium]|nr:type II toxin-antitoxin system RelE/ParE family toxin [Coriobacteriia bacterium]
MAPYRLLVAASAERMLRRLPETAASAMVEFMTGPLVENPARVGKPLMFDLEGYLCARRGPYRVIYRFDEAERSVRVVRVDHRADVYRTR